MTSKLIDNQRVSLIDALAEQLPNFNKISIATGYWDLKGFRLVESYLEAYESVRILIGQEPLPPAFAKRFDLNQILENFPEENIREGLAELEQTDELRKSARALKNWMDQGKVQVKILRGSFLHAKAYVLGDYSSSKAIGLIGSSNFTEAGLTKNLELNYLEDNTHSVIFRPKSDHQPHSHLSWFDEIWSSENAEDWNGRFSDLIDSSSLGGLTYSRYHMYVKALYEIYSDELVNEIDTNQEIEDVLYDFQLRNAKLLIQKLQKSSVAILADSVGLGKTITAGAVVKTYIEERGSARVYVIAPASLTGQWKKELAGAFSLISGFEVISLQDVRAIREARELDQYAPVDLFVVDEAHNLRSGNGSRYDELLDWFTDNPDSHVLLLTATPINNSLHDLKNQIQLGSKGKLHSVKVTYKTESKVEVIDFFEAIERLNKEIKSAITLGKRPDYEKVNKVMRQGLRPYLVRTTRTGITNEFGGIKTSDGVLLKFPESVNNPTKYEFDRDSLANFQEILDSSPLMENGIDIGKFDIDALLELTQRAEHPIDAVIKSPGVHNKIATDPFEIVFKCLISLGFSPYKGDTYKHKFYSKPSEEILKIAAGSEDEAKRLPAQLTVHNMLRVTFLKRLESSQFAFKVSLQNYLKRLNQFDSLLQGGKIGRIRDLESVLDIFGDDVDQQDAANEERLEEFDLQSADPTVFNLDALKLDIERDREIVKVLLLICDQLANPDAKLHALAKLLHEIVSTPEYGGKVLVFSYYSDTIAHLKESLAGLVDIQNFSERSAFVSGASRGSADEFAKRFSPNSKKASDAVRALGEIDFLFATDVLSEGQNLQDCGVIVNFDLHWNPVRMIQRNGRINRLGSGFSKVHIFNMHPDKSLNRFLTLVERLNNKIDQIKFSIGTDQSILGEESNPQEFVDLYSARPGEKIKDPLDDDQELLGEDEFVRDLRKFDATASEFDRKTVESIGLGKWGYIPPGFSAHIHNSTILALARIEGRFRHNNEKFRSHIFIRKADRYSPVENFAALSALRVGPEDSQRHLDQIDVNRSDVSTKVAQLAKLHVASRPTSFRQTPKVRDAISIYSKHKGTAEGLDTALDRVQTRQALKRAKQIIRLINSSASSSGGLSKEAIDTVASFISQMMKQGQIGVEVNEDGVQGVLYFGV